MSHSNTRPCPDNSVVFIQDTRAFATSGTHSDEYLTGIVSVWNWVVVSSTVDRPNHCSPQRVSCIALTDAVKVNLALVVHWFHVRFKARRHGSGTYQAADKVVISQKHIFGDSKSRRKHRALAKTLLADSAD